MRVGGAAINKIDGYLTTPHHYVALLGDLGQMIFGLKKTLVTNFVLKRFWFPIVDRTNYQAFL